MRNAASMPSRPPVAGRRGVAVTAAGAAIAALLALALADGAATMERLIETVPPEIVEGLAHGLLMSSLAP